MKNLILKILILVLSLSLMAFAVGCDETVEDNGQTTGNYKYKVETRTVYDEEKEENVEHKYYVITGYEVSSEDALKMADGDYSTVTAFREIEIPKTGKDISKDLNDYPVEEIEAGAFSNQVILTSVKVGSNILKIGEGAFAGCTNLKSLTLPFVGESVDAVNSKRLFGYIFGASATGEGNVQVTTKNHERKDDSGESILNESEVTFYVPSSLTTIDLSSSTITSISECAFYGVTTIKNITIPETVVDIESHAFFGCTALASFDMKNVKNVYEYAFSGCTSLLTVDFKNVEVLQKAVFENCSKLGAKKLANSDDEELLTIKLPASVKELGKKAFSGCSSIVYFNLKGTAVTTIENSAFANMVALKKITINDNSVIKTGAFTGCALLKKNVEGTYTQEVKAFDD